VIGLVLDAGAFIGLEHRKRHVVALLERARARSIPMVTSAAVVGQVWRGHRRQAAIALALSWPNLDVLDLTAAHGHVIGRMLAASGTSDVIDAHVVLIARDRGWPAVTSDRADLARIDPTLSLHEI
jgi:hypothetical protein